MHIRAIDYEKGVITALMVFCHVLQFFGRPDSYPVQYGLMSGINAMAFSLFVFAYGRSVAASWSALKWRQGLLRALRSALRAYIAYVISGSAYLILCGGDKFAITTIRRVACLRAIPGWSEFLAAFAVMGVLVGVALPLLTRLVDRPWPLLGACAACLACTYLPVGSVRPGLLGLLIGSWRFACFPVLQYLPFLLAGMYVQRHGLNRVFIALAAAASAVGIFWWVRFGEPNRFPPSLMWLLTPWLGIVLLDAGCGALSRLTERSRAAGYALRPIGFMGANSLFYLLATNLCIFAVSHSALLPVYRRSAPFPFNLTTGSTAWALIWTLVLLLAVGFMASIARSRRGRIAVRSAKGEPERENAR